jgi:hypothetical protein
MSDDSRVELRALSANDRDEFVEAMVRSLGDPLRALDNAIEVALKP